MKKILMIVVALVTVFCFTIPGMATLVSYDFKGKVTAFDDNSVYGGLNVGDTFTGSFSYDSATEASSISSLPSYGIYFLLGTPGSSFVMNLGGTVLAATSSYYLQTWNDRETNTGYPEYTTFYSDSVNMHCSTGGYQWNVGFSNNSGTSPASPLASADLPLTYSLADWAVYQGGSILWQDFTGAKASSDLRFSFTELSASTYATPEPASLLLLGLGLLGMVSLRKKMK